MSTNAAEVLEQDRVEKRLRSAIRKIAAQHPGDHDRGADALLKLVRRHPEYHALALECACRYWIRHTNFNVRSESRATVSTLPVIAGSDQQRAMMQTVMDRWYDWPLPFGMGRAGDATRETCKLISEKYYALELGNKANRKTIEEYGKAIPEGKKARDVMSSDEIGKILGRLK